MTTVAAPTSSMKDGENDHTADNNIKRVVICGAGPAGLLLTALLLQHNKDSSADDVDADAGANKSNKSSTKYHVTLIDNRQDFGTMSPSEVTKRHKSWMLALANHGCEALRELPGLFEEYVQTVAIQQDSITIFLGGKYRLDNKLNADGNGDIFEDGYIIDRNQAVACIARYVQDRYHDDNQHYRGMYDTQCQYVDHDNKRVLTKDIKTGVETYVDYDLLVGCDGIRSVVRQAFVQRHHDFECDVGHIFQPFKSVHVKRPTAITNERCVSICVEVLPSTLGIVLAEHDGIANINFGTSFNRFDKLPAELKSKDYEVVSKYLRDNLVAFELDDYDDFAKQWVNQRWNHTGQVHCNFYHSRDDIVLMGDAAHATSPAIGQGMNQALKDAQVLCRLLKEHDHDFQTALPAFSEARVKEGNALTELSMHLSCFDTTTVVLETVHEIIRTKLHTWFPKWVDNHARALVGLRGYSLNDIYILAKKQGIIRKNRRINEHIRRDFFERQVGMMIEPAGIIGSSTYWVTLASSVMIFTVVVMNYYSPW